MSIADDVTRVVRHELRAVLPVHVPDPYRPPPCDLDAEGEVLSAILDGHATQAQLAPLESHHFYAALHSAIWTAASECPPGDLEGIFRCLDSRGWYGAISIELSGLVLNQPWICVPRLQAHVPRLIDLADRRQLIERLHKLQVELSAGTLTAAEARAAV